MTLEKIDFLSADRIYTTLEMITCIDGMGDELFPQKLLKHFWNGTHIEEYHFDEIPLNKEGIS